MIAGENGGRAREGVGVTALATAIAPSAAGSYADFLQRKGQHGADCGFEPVWLPSWLFDFQAFLDDWAIRKGRAAIFADCGTGKTPEQLVWAQNVVEYTNRPVLILTPLAVAAQTVRESGKFGIPCERIAAGSPRSPQIYVTNYEKLHLFEPQDWAGVVCDESSILKSFDGTRRQQITDFLRRIAYRLLCTATAAPNDYIELGTSSEALGELGYVDMLNRFFVNDTRNSATRRFHGMTPKWRFKGWAKEPFWKWVSTWARACRKPSDLGFSDEKFELPALIEQEHVIESRTLPPGQLFAMAARDMFEEREERRRTIHERCEAAAGLVADTGQSAVVWCHLNAEGDLIEKLVPDGRQVSGADPDERKEELYEAFGTGQLRVLVTKPKIGAWGLNWQHCAHTVTFASHSYEQYYQSVRRLWRFGQTQPVVVDLVASEGERGMQENLKRKSAQADEMFAQLVLHMREAARVTGQEYSRPVEVPRWL